MAEHQHNRNFLTKTVQTLRNTLKKHFIHKFGRNFSLDSGPVMQNRSASLSARGDSDMSTYNLNPSRPIRNISAPQHHRSLCRPTNTNHEHVYGHEQDKNSPERSRVTKSLRIRRLASRLNPIEAFPRTQTSVKLRRKSMFASSSLPTPTEPPKDDLYSHSVYQEEGRRSVLSPLGRRWMMKSRETGISESRTRRPSIQGNVTSQHPGIPFIVIRMPSVQYSDDRNKSPTVLAPALAPIRKERTGLEDSSNRQSLLPRYYQNRNTLASFEVTSAETTRSTMAPPKRIRLTQGFENLKKTQVSQRTKLPMPKQNLNPSPVKATGEVLKTHLQQPTHERIKENDSPTIYLTGLQQPTALPLPYIGSDINTIKDAKKLASKLPLVSTSSTRRKIQIEKMVLPPRDPRHNIHIIARAPSRLSNPKRRPALNPRVNSLPQVETDMPQAYWLGRFMTLTNAFHYEDSFHEPDIATGFEMPSSYSRPFQGSDDGNLAGYRVKRAFMVLENLCVTEEASDSLRKFRDGYIRRFGDRWMV
ncbi:hypothetical protein BDW62DRAFT_212919 [Aspergillus aurantiobrunneus]